MVMFYGKSAPNGQFSTGRLSWRNGVFRDNDPAGWIIWGKGMDIWRLGERSNNQILEGKPGGMMQQKSQIKYQLFINNLPCQTILQLDLPFPKGFPMPRSCASLQSSPGQEIQDSGCYGREAEELLAAG